MQPTYKRTRTHTYSYTQLFHEEEGVKVYELELPGSSVHVVKAIGTYGGMPVALCSCSYDTNTRLSSLR